MRPLVGMAVFIMVVMVFLVNGVLGTFFPRAVDRYYVRTFGGHYMFGATQRLRVKYHRFTGLMLLGFFVFVCVHVLWTKVSA